MKKLSSNQLSNGNLLTINNEKRKKLGKLFLKSLKHKNTAPYIPSKFKTAKNNIFTVYNENIFDKKKTTENIIINEYNKTKGNSDFIPNKNNSSTKKNLLTFYKNSNTKSNNNIYILPNINNFENIFKNDIISKFKNNNKEKIDKK